MPPWCTGMRNLCLFFVVAVGLSACASPDHDIIIRGGTVYDGSGMEPYVADVAIDADSISVVSMLPDATARTEIDATGKAVSPGFINMLSWAAGRLVRDGRSMSDIMQGITVEVFGEGTSEGPLSEAMKAEEFGPDDDFTWTTLREFLDGLEARGISTNVASFVGATTVRVHELGHEDRAPSDAELRRMRGLVRRAMEDGALGLGTSLIYAPAFYADTEELIALSDVVAEYDGLYVSHMRSEGNRLLEALEELLTIGREAGVRTEIFHLKAAGADNWHKLDSVIVRVEKAQAAGQVVGANMYTYTAGSTGLDAAMPPWVQEGGFGAWRERLMDGGTRRRVEVEISTPTDSWENLYLAAGAEGTMIAGLRQDSLRHLIGRRLSDIAMERGQRPEDTIVDLVIQDSSRVEVVYFLMSEDNVRRQIALPWMAFGSDAGSMAPEGRVLEQSQHPRAYGNVARLLGRYVRDEGVISLEEAVRRLTSLPAGRLRLEGRGRLEPGYLADIVVFDPDSIRDHATFEDPHRLATGVEHVLVNGVPVVRNGAHTGAMPGRALRRGIRRDSDMTVIIEGAALYGAPGMAPGTVADVGLRNDQIAAIGDLSGAWASSRINARGLAIAPGFIDIHSHATGTSIEGSAIVRRPMAENYLRQGVTTAMSGQDGSSTLDVGALLAWLDNEPGAINIGQFVGHGSVRAAVLGEGDRDPDADELREMTALVKRAMDEGAFGLSSGLEYTPGAFAETDEIAAVAAPAADAGGLYISHIRDEGGRLLESVQEVIDVARQAGIRAQVTHHKVIGKGRWGRSSESLALIDAARSEGIDVSSDVYPYTASSTGMTILFPDWAKDGGSSALRARLSNPETRASIRADVAEHIRVERGADPSTIVAAVCAHDPSLNGMSLADMLQARGLPVTVEGAADMAMELVAAGGCSGVFHSMSPQDVARIMQHEWTSISSDGGIPAFGEGVPHPRNYGAFARVLGRYVREEGVLDLPVAIDKMTRLPAERLGLKDRGVLAPGYKADIVVFDPESIRDTAEFGAPHAYAEGVHHVFVNGRAALLDGELTGARPGRALRMSREGNEL